MTGWETCELCGIVGTPDQIGGRIVAWRDASQHRGKPYETIVRCRDSQACRDRYETPGRIWLVTDTTQPTRPTAIKVVGQTAQIEAGDGAEDEAEAERWLAGGTGRDVDLADRRGPLASHALAPPESSPEIAQELTRDR